MKCKIWLWLIAIITVFICLAANIAKAQSKIKLFDYQTTWEVNTSPLSFLSSRPKLKIGVDYYLFRFLILGGDFGYGGSFVNANLPNNPWEDQYRLFMFDIGAKVVLPNRCTQCDPYLSLSYFYLNMRSNIYNDYYVTDLLNNDLATWYDLANYQQERFGWLYKAGIKIYLNPSMALDVYGGVGLIERNQSYSDLVNEQLLPYNKDNNRFGRNDYRTFEDGNIIVANAGVRIGWLFTGFKSVNFRY